jgi:hypothetical protein
MIVQEIVGDSTSMDTAPGNSPPPGQYKVFKSFKVE